MADSWTEEGKACSTESPQWKLVRREIISMAAVCSNNIHQLFKEIQVKISISRCLSDIVQDSLPQVGGKLDFPSCRGWFNGWVYVICGVVEAIYYLSQCSRVDIGGVQT